MTFALDHILWGAPDLDDGVRAFSAITGITPVAGGSHPGFGTRNRLLSLSASVFFEIIAPDPEQTQAPGSRGATIAAMPHPGLLTFAVQMNDMDADCASAERAGLILKRRIPMNRTRPDGVRLDWTIVQFAHPAYGEAIPFAIDWQGSPHPAATTPGGCSLQSFTVLHPEPKPLVEIYRKIGIEIAVRGALRPGFIVVLDTPNGEVCLQSA
jgi:hypothetical protein